MREGGDGGELGGQGDRRQEGRKAGRQGDREAGRQGGRKQEAGSRERGAESGERGAGRAREPESSPRKRGSILLNQTWIPAFALSLPKSLFSSFFPLEREACAEDHGVQFLES